MARKFIDCRESPSVSGCTLTIAGEEDEVVRAAALHAKDVHGHEDTAEFRDMIRKNLKEEMPSTAATPAQPTGQQPAPMH